MVKPKHDFPRNNKPARGSDDQPSEPRVVAIGQITKAHGVRGEVSVTVLTDFVERFDQMDSVLIGDQVETSLYQVESVRWNKDRVLMKFAGITDRTAAEALRRLYLQVPVSEVMPLEPDVYYEYQLLGLSVVTDEGQPVGILSEVLETGANDVYVVRNGQQELLIPATAEVIKAVDLEKKQMVVHLIEGLI